MVAIGGIQKSSLIDYPEKISAIIFTQGCNFRCPYCHNPELITSCRDKAEPSNAKNLLNPASHTNDILNMSNENKKRKFIFQDDVLDFLKSRIGKLDGVVITGGEPSLHKDLPEFIKKIKDMGFAIKLDTNGTNPSMLEKLIQENMIDYVAMDIKAPIDQYSELTC